MNCKCGNEMILLVHDDQYVEDAYWCKNCGTAAKTYWITEKQSEEVEWFEREK